MDGLRNVQPMFIILLTGLLILIVGNGDYRWCCGQRDLVIIGGSLCIDRRRVSRGDIFLCLKLMRFVLEGVCCGMRRSGCYRCLCQKGCIGF